MYNSFVFLTLLLVAFLPLRERNFSVSREASANINNTCLSVLHSLIDRGLVDDSLRYSHIGAIMITESGLQGVSRPSQFVMNFGGESKRFSDKKLALKYLSSRDDTNVDIGCMQINLAAHCKEYTGSCTKESRLKMAEKLFNKEENILFALKLLKRAKAKGKLGYYHSATEDKYNQYVSKVNKVLESAGLTKDFK